MLNANSPLPLYHQLAEILMADIKAGKYPEGNKIPSENLLATQYGIGRPTVRQAVGSLVRRGVLVRRRGSGTYVAQQPETVNLFSLTGTLKSLKNTGCELEVELVNTPSLQSVDDEEANPFHESEAITLCRLSRLDGAPVLVEDIYMHAQLFAGIENMDLEGQSLSGVVEETFKLALSSAEQHFRITYPDKRLSKLLKIPTTMPILTVNRYLHFAHQGPAARNAIYSTLHCRTDQFIFTQQIGGISNV